jgi:hypothetical protein
VFALCQVAFRFVHFIQAFLVSARELDSSVALHPARYGHVRGRPRRLGAWAAWHAGLVSASRLKRRRLRRNDAGRTIGRCFAMNRDRGKLFESVLQVLAIACLIGLFSMVAHRAVVDIAALAQLHSGGDFWAALARHVLRNLPGG